MYHFFMNMVMVNCRGAEGAITMNNDDHIYIALFSALKQTRCALVACDSE